MKKKTLNKSEIKGFNQNIIKFDYELDKKGRVEHIQDEKYEILLVNGEPEFFFINNNPIPTLKLLLKKPVLKKVTVDMGAVKFMVKGADCMRPGITTMEDGIEKDEYIVIVDETHGKPLAVGQMIYSKKEIDEMDSGKVIKTIHFIGDDIWNFS